MEFLAIFQNDTIGLEECGVMILKIFLKNIQILKGLFMFCENIVQALSISRL